MNLTNDDVQEILRLLDSSPYDELSLETDHFKLLLKRSEEDGVGWTQQTRTLDEPNIVSDHTSVGRDSTVSEAAGQVEPNRDKSEAGVEEVEAPLIGTFYRAPKPGADPFVKVGDTVGRDTVIGIIEVMKLMNSVPAGMTGEIIEICAEDAEFVEQGSVLMRIRVTPA